MMDRPQSAMFLERRSYRRRRLMDALRLLPILGVMLWTLPIFWPSGEDATAASNPVPMSNAVLYVFAVWVALIALAFGLWRSLWFATATDTRLAHRDSGEEP